MIKVWVDGLAKGNHLKGKGEAAVGVVIEGTIRRNWLSHKIKEPLTNNEAEYVALLVAARYIRMVSGKGEDVFIFSDSALVVNQLNGVWKTNDKKFIPIQDEIRSLLDGANVYYIWVNREQTKEADRLANQAFKAEGSPMYSVQEFFGGD